METLKEKKTKSLYIPDAVPKEDVGDARGLGTTLVETKGAERGVMLPALGRRDPFIPKGYGHPSRDVASQD